MSVEVWDGDELLGLASERIVEYIDNLEARAGALKREIDTWEACVRKGDSQIETLQERAHGLEGRLRRLHRWLRKARGLASVSEMRGIAARLAIDAGKSLERRAVMADELAKAARALLDALTACNPHINGAFALSAVHGMPYDGPTYARERKELTETVARYDATKEAP